MEKGITKRSESYSKWYLDIVEKAELAENSSVKGCMVIRPYGYAIWENIQKELDRRIKESGHSNAYFPLFIPKSFLSKEATHAKGFAKECAIVTHYRLKETADGKGVEVDENAKLEDELIVRPTSETIMYDTFSRWVSSWRDLPLKINQWANIVRWERRTRPFLRTSEFLWQEGHTVFATHEESKKEVMDMLKMYSDFAREFLAIETIFGKKSESEKFAGALDTYGVEAMMQDGKGLQFGTSHDLGQGFAEVFNIMFTDKDGTRKYPWQNSWGVSTRMMGALVMSHSDDFGLILPPNIAPIKVVIVPIFNDTEKESILTVCKRIKDELGDIAHLDDRDFVSPGYKFNEWEIKGVPIRMEIGPKDIASSNCVLVRRDILEKMNSPLDSIKNTVMNLLEEIQKNLLSKSKDLLVSKTHNVSSYEEFKRVVKEEKGFILASWCGDPKCEEMIKSETTATTRCLTKEGSGVSGKCVYCDKESADKWTFAISY